MIYSSLAVLALSASAAVSPLSNLVHLHHAKQVENRVTLKLSNSSMMFRDITVGNQTYTITAHASLDIKAPLGTKVYAASPTPQYKQGDVMLTINSTMNNANITLR